MSARKTSKGGDDEVTPRRSAVLRARDRLRQARLDLGYAFTDHATVRVLDGLIGAVEELASEAVTGVGP